MSLKSEDVYHRVREAITYGELKPGERLIESRICETFKVGRTPLREAIRLLQVEGYVDFLPNRGVTITKLSIRDVEEIYNIVAILEGYAANTATKRLGPEDIKELRSIHNDIIESGKKKDYRSWLEGNALFHRYFAIASGNNHLLKQIKNLRDRVYRYRFIALTILGHNEEYAQAHGEILEAVCRRNAQGAGKAMRNHVLRVRKVLVDFLKDSLWL